MKKEYLVSALAVVGMNVWAADWDGVAVPADAGPNNTWELQTAPSDDFNYEFKAASSKANFGNHKWYNFYHNEWDGPGTTYWQFDHVSVDGTDLVIKASRNPSTVKMGVPGVNAGCITSHSKVKYPVFVEASVSVADIALASDVWLLSMDDTQEIDIIECYGGANYFQEFIHLSHHSFIRHPFTDYQPKDENSWWAKPGVTNWGAYCFNRGNRKYIRIGVNWIGPKHFEYYIDGELVRVLYDKAFATKKGTTWHYTYPTMSNGKLDSGGGYQTVVELATGTEYSFEILKGTSNASSTSVIDPYNYQRGHGFTKELDIIINVESQDWHVAAGRTPSDADLKNPDKNTMKVDWIRVYKPVMKGGAAAKAPSAEPGKPKSSWMAFMEDDCKKKGQTFHAKWFSDRFDRLDRNGDGILQDSERPK
ncbi:Beta-agarase D [Pontiella desulfatans]|uniref:Beta-agarase D n=1 Tax=Pontiella desulfatans TaxID=2750659 RepID=A0A6C2TYV9_PONDE|nr:beta-agarase [Pontiella desulfatans]VGO12785.1 Beta-agarase D [Pontiella desulfatans]